MHSPGPWRALRWWESAGLTLADATDDDERQSWERAPYKYIEDANGKSVVSCHDLATIAPADARVLEAAPDMLALLWFVYNCLGLGDGLDFDEAKTRVRAFLARMGGDV